MANTAPTRVLVVDEGELQDIRELLTWLGVLYAEARSVDMAAIPTELSLLVTNARHALDSGTRQPRSFVHLVVYDGVSPTLHEALRRSGCDLVLQRPVNPHTFRLLTEQALYEGPERRKGRRVVLSAPVELRASDRTRSATLVQLSLRGCSLSVQEPIKIGSEVQLSFPPDLTGGDPLRTSGPILSVRKLESGSGLHELAMAFRLMDAGNRRILNDIMARHGCGAELRPRRAAQPATGRTEGEAQGERRTKLRKSFTQRVIAAGAGISHMLIGRDLSSEGMRVQPEPGLELGDEIKLAVYGRPGQPAIMLKAVVTRDEGENGLVLRFLDVPASIAARLERIVAELPALPDESSGASQTKPGLVVSEIFGRR